ncbi:MAG: ankyrin repeat domain-containing protein, partial [Candidatus Brocadiia bacterium]|nr:ankyrin repeat domain-containing protein [Candidatus Brocadiia bacterium]
MGRRKKLILAVGALVLVTAAIASVCWLLLRRQQSKYGRGPDWPSGPLFLAAAQRDIPRLEAFLEAYPEVLDTRGFFGRTALFSAATDGDSEVVEFLLKKGAAPGPKDDQESTPLHWAAWHGHERVVTLLLEAGAAVDARDDSGHTPLARAAIDGHTQVAKLLLAKE